MLGVLVLAGVALEAWRRHRAWWDGPHLREQLEAWRVSDPVIPPCVLLARPACKITRTKIRRRQPAQVVRGRFDPQRSTPP